MPFHALDRVPAWTAVVPVHAATGQPGAAVPTWSPAGQLPGGGALALRIGGATELLIGIGQEGMGFAGIGLDLGRFFQVVERVQRIALQRENPPPQQVGAVVIGTEPERGIELAVSVVPLVFTAVAFGPLAALVVGILANSADLRRPYLKWAVYTPARGLTGAAAGLAAVAVLAHTHTEPTFLTMLAAALAASVAHLFVDVAIAMGTLAIRGSGSPLSYPRTILPLFILSTAFYVPVVAFLAYGYSRYSFAVVASFLLPVLALQRVGAGEPLAGLAAAAAVLGMMWSG